MSIRLALAAATAVGLALSASTAAAAKDNIPASPAPVVVAPAQAAAPAPQAPPHRASPQERLEAERLDPLARAAFWAHEVQVDARDLEAGVRLAAALRVLGRNEEAAQAAQVVLVVDPQNKDATLELARDFLTGGQGFYAIDPLKRLQAGDARDWRTWSLLGVAYDQVQRTDDAVAAWKQALALSPENPGVLSNLAMHYAAAGDPAQAEGLLRRAVTQPGASIQVRQNLVLVLGLQGKLAEAERLVREDLPPEVANNNLAYLRAAGGDGRSWKALQGAQAAAN